MYIKQIPTKRKSLSQHPINISTLIKNSSDSKMTQTKFFDLNQNQKIQKNVENVSTIMKSKENLLISNVTKLIRKTKRTQYKIIENVRRPISEQVYLYY